MSRTLTLVLTGAMALGLTACDRPAKLDNEKSKYSYAIGHQIGKNIQSQGVELDEKAFMAAIKDVMKKKDPRLKEDEMRDAMRKMAESRRAKAQVEAKENLAKAKTFLEGNAKQAGWKQTDSGLQYQVVKAGTGASPKPEDVVTVHYRGKLIDGTEFDSSYKREKAAEFPVKAVIPGWTEALQLMKVGGKFNLAIPPSLGYGATGNQKIPGNSVLLFEVELLDIKDPAKK